ncbi:MAG: hypothetical protein H6922_05755 [Pseudomonadaceae bacterium]|nr:hypothetical protein [Pseudomonadaceae bacterium]
MADRPAPLPPKPRKSGSDVDILAKLRELPTPAKVALGVVLFGVFYLMLGGGNQSQQTGGAPNVTSEAALNQENGQVFSGLESDRPVLMQGWLEQNRREMADLKSAIEQKFDEKDKALADALQQNADLQAQMRQMMADFTAEIRNIQTSNQQDKEMLSQLAEEQRRIQLNAPADGVTGVGPVQRQQKRIDQTPLSGGGNVSGQPLLAPLTRLGANGEVRSTGEPPSAVDAGGGESYKLPFVPPLGFIKGTMLNGVDALIGGQPTPALVRLSGNYKTAMGSTVNLDGCFALVEFQGEISTERAVGKPARMTCVYPDQGTVTYSLSGYVVDSEDGIIGVPGVFYEGDASRIAAAMLADFAAGVSAVVRDNQTTVSVDANGNATQSITGDELKGEIAGGVEKAVGSLRDYLLQRVSRVLPFVRLDATRQIHIVLLSGTELRAEGSPWTLLFDAEAADSARAQRAQQTSANGGQ